MTTCATFDATGPAGISDALQKVDCMAAEATSFSFGRLFGEHGSLHTALTIALTLYVALLAVNLLTGRSALRLSVLTPKMMTLGLVLTFITSWVAYQSVVWNLAVGAPDEIASVLVGTEGSATTMFAQRLDAFFAAITAAADAVSAAAVQNPAAAAASAAFASPANVLSIAALLLLLGTVGVLVVCRLALAALLILGPVFIVFALFEGTRGLFEGWLKSVAMFALVPLLTVLLGSGALVAISPMVAGLSAVGADIPLRTAVSILVASMVYVALMLVAMKIAASLTRGWRMARATPEARPGQPASVSQGVALAATDVHVNSPARTVMSDRVRTAVAGVENSLSVSRLASATLAPAAAGQRVVQMPLLTAEPLNAKHGSYFNHRTQRSAFEFPREMIR